MYLYVTFLIFYFCCILQTSTGEEYLITDQVFFDIELNDENIGTITFGLYGKIAPKTVENFKTIATKGIDGNSYEGTKFLKAVKRVMILGGDVLYNNGSGSVSIYGDYFSNENYDIKPEAAGLLTMANFGSPDSNGCMFIITTMATPWLDGKNTIFGKVLKGHRVVHMIEYLRTDINDNILDNVTISKSGIIPGKPFEEVPRDYELTFWAWIKAGWFPLSFSLAILFLFQYLKSLL